VLFGQLKVHVASLRANGFFQEEVKVGLVLVGDAPPEAGHHLHHAVVDDVVLDGGIHLGTDEEKPFLERAPWLVVIFAESYERIHRSNLVGMGVLPLQFKDSDTLASLNLTGDETFDLIGINNNLKPQQDVTLTITRKDGSKQSVTLLLRIDTPIEVDYYRHGGILPYVLRELVSK